MQDWSTRNGLGEDDCAVRVSTRLDEYLADKGVVAVRWRRGESRERRLSSVGREVGSQAMVYVDCQPASDRLE